MNVCTCYLFIYSMSQKRPTVPQQTFFNADICFSIVIWIPLVALAHKNTGFLSQH